MTASLPFSKIFLDLENVECTNPCEKANAVLGCEYTMKNPHNIMKNRNGMYNEKKMKTTLILPTTILYLKIHVMVRSPLIGDDKVQNRNSQG